MEFKIEWKGAIFQFVHVMCLTSVYSEFPKGWEWMLYNKTCFHQNSFFSLGTQAGAGELFGRDALCECQPLDPQPIASSLSLKDIELIKIEQ